MFGLLNRKLSRQWTSKNTTKPLGVDGKSIASNDDKESGALSPTSVDDPRNQTIAMSISTTCRKVIINEGILSAECLKADNVTYVTSSISLDAFLGNVDGKFIQGGKNFSQSAQDVGIIGGVIYGKLQAPGDQYVDAKFDLQKLIVNNDGVLTATIPEGLDIGKATAPGSTKTLPAASGFSAASTTPSLPTSIPSQSSSNVSNNPVISPVVPGSLDTPKATTPVLEKALSTTSPPSATSSASGLSVTSTTPSLATSIPSSSLNNNHVITPVIPGSLDTAKAIAPVLETNLSTASSASAASAANGLSATSTTASLATSIPSQSSSSFNNNRVITAVVPGSLDTAKASTPISETVLPTTSSPSAASVASGFSSMSTTSSFATSMSSQSSSSSVQKRSSTFNSTTFGSQSQQYLIEDSGSNFLLKDAFFHLDLIRSDGSVTHTSIDLDLYIGIVNGQLQWGATGFSKACQSFRLEGFFLVVEIPAPAKDNGFKLEYVTSRLDLRTHLRISGSGIVIYLETNKKLSVMLSEVPWMKFKVIAEPDLSVFASHPVIKHTLARIAESTVEHFTVNMHRMLTVAMQEAIVTITTSVMKHVSMEIERSVRDAVGYAAASPSVVEAEYLHIAQESYPEGGYGGRAYEAAGYATGGYGAGGGYTAGGGYQTGGYVGGTYAGGATGTNGTIQVGTGGGGAASARSTLVSTGSVSASQSVSRSESDSSDTNTAASTSTTQAETQLVSVQI